MSFTDPIPGKSPEAPPKPEAPKGGIKVEVRQPEMLYDLAKKQRTGEAGTFIGISTTLLNDDMFRSEGTDLHTFTENWSVEHSYSPQPRIDGTYHFTSSLALSETRQNRGDYGFFSENKVERIATLLREKGCNAKVSEMWRGVKKGVIFIEKDGLFTEVFFGFHSKEAKEAETLASVEIEKKAGKEGVATQYQLPELKAGYKNTGISIDLEDKGRVENGTEGHPPLTDKVSFTRSLEFYADTYQKVLEAMYEEEGKPTPNKSIVIRPPVLNQDTTAQIKSIETPSPQIVTEQEITRERTSFDDIAGQEVAVAEAKRLVLGINHPEVFERRGVKRPKGVLFHGPPGTGKTMIARAVAEEANADFFSITAADIGTKWYGESENLMQKVFDRANEAAKAGRKVVLYFDEIDALAPNREGAHEATQKVISVILQNMDGMKANPNVTVIASTNRPEGIDAALRRPGRFDKFIYVGLPSVGGREKILKVHMDKAKKAATAPGELFASDVDFSRIAQLTEGTSGADLANILNLALEEKTMEELEGSPWTPINTQDLETMVKRLGNIKEEKQRMGFIPKNTNGNGVSGVVASKQ